MTNKSELEELKSILEEDYFALINEGESVTTDLGDFTTVSAEEGDTSRWHQWIHLVTRTPSGKLYMWSYGSGLTEYQDDEEIDFSDIKEVVQKTRVVVQTYYEKL